MINEFFMKKCKLRYLFILTGIFSIGLAAFTLPHKRDNLNRLQENRQGIILNVAADALVDYSRWGLDIDSITKEQAINAIREYVNQYANTQVNCMLFNVNYLRACYDSKVMTPYWEVPDPSNNLSEWTRKYWQINKKGIDIFKVCVEQSRAKKISPWLSFRMNDHHYLNNPYLINQLMIEHPEFRLSPAGSFDYGQTEVRNYYKAFIKEALERYDVDGIELDWMRTFFLFKPGMESGGIDLINIFMKDIRNIVEQNSKERGHQIQIAARIPVTPSIGRSFGLDGVEWVKNGSVDILIPSNFHYPTNFDIPVEQWKAEIGNKYSYMLAPGMDLGIMCVNTNNSKIMYNSVETVRAFAISAYSRGADAIYLFNNFSLTENSFASSEKKIVNADGTIKFVNDKPDIIREGGRLSTIKGKKRRHVLTYTNPGISGTKPLLPQVITAGNPASFKIYTGPKTEKEDYIIRVGLESLAGFREAALTIKLNDCNSVQINDLPVDPSYKYDSTGINRIATDVSETAARIMQFKNDPGSVKAGNNIIKVFNERSDVQKIIWLEVCIE